jgi:hypothetical protein
MRDEFANLGKGRLIAKLVVPLHPAPPGGEIVSRFLLFLYCAAAAAAASVAAAGRKTSQKNMENEEAEAARFGSVWAPGERGIRDERERGGGRS